MTQTTDLTYQHRELHGMLFDVISGLLDVSGLKKRAKYLLVADACNLSPKRAKEIVDMAFSYGPKRMPDGSISL